MASGSYESFMFITIWNLTRQYSHFPLKWNSEDEDQETYALEDAFSPRSSRCCGLIAVEMEFKPLQRMLRGAGLFDFHTDQKNTNTSVYFRGFSQNCRNAITLTPDMAQFFLN